MDIYSIILRYLVDWDCLYGMEMLGDGLGVGVISLR